MLECLHMTRRFLLAIILALTVAGPLAVTDQAHHFVAPALAAETDDAPVSVQASADQGVFAKFFGNVAKGAAFYWNTVRGWFAGLFERFSTARKAKLEALTCEEQADCPAGTACLNACPGDGDCRVFVKRCRKGPDVVLIKPESAACGSSDVCAPGTACVRTCGEGALCETPARCQAQESPVACAIDADCRETCAAKGLPPIGYIARRAVCRAGGCDCGLEEVDPSLPRANCAAGTDMKGLICPPGASPACTDGGCIAEACAPRLTCLTAPEYGGTCVTDAVCAGVICDEGFSPFCAADAHCRCHKTEEQAVRCDLVSDCAAITCGTGETKLCAGGTCACGRTEIKEEEIRCRSAADCPANCSSGYQRACVNSACACQRTVESGPVACSSLSDCGGVSCPSGFEKACLNAQCSCTRTVQQE
jgi:hypothetical protein